MSTGARCVLTSLMRNPRLNVPIPESVFFSEAESDCRAPLLRISLGSQARAKAQYRSAVVADKQQLRGRALHISIDPKPEGYAQHR